MNTQLKKLEQAEALTASEAVLKYKLDWQVSKKDVFVNNGLAKEYKAIVRNDTGSIFQIAGSRYEPVQNSEALNCLDEIVKTGQAKYVQGGYYKGGAVVWLRVKVPYDFDVLPNDPIKTYLKLVNSHDGSHKLTVFPEVYRQVCTNGMHAWVQDHARTVAVKHTINCEKRFVTNAKEIYAEEIAYFQKQKEALQALARKQLTTLEIDSLIYQIFEADEGKRSDIPTKTKNQIERVQELVHVGLGQSISGVQGTAYSVYNAVTEYVDYHRPTRGDSENREYSAEFGSGRDLRERAFELLLK
jgi:phage/plasmid-like protein (TIGR03299 family)